MRKVWKSTHAWFEDLDSILNNLEKSGKTIFSILLDGKIYTIIYYELKEENI